VQNIGQNLVTCIEQLSSYVWGIQLQVASALAFFSDAHIASIIA
jgi:hypothetical protein